MAAVVMRLAVVHQQPHGLLVIGPGQQPRPEFDRPAAAAVASRWAVSDPSGESASDGRLIRLRGEKATSGRCQKTSLRPTCIGG